MEDFASWFTGWFCRVQFVCHQGEINWLGYLVIGFAFLFILGLFT